MSKKRKAMRRKSKEKNKLTHFTSFIYKQSEFTDKEFRCKVNQNIYIQALF